MPFGKRALAVLVGTSASFTARSNRPKPLKCRHSGDEQARQMDQSLRRSDIVAVQRGSCLQAETLIREATDSWFSSKISFL